MQDRLLYDLKEVADLAPDKENIIECWVIILILAIAAYMFIRGHRKAWGGSVFPLMLVPFVNIIYSPINRKILSYNLQMAYTVRTILYAVSFAGVCIWVTLWSRKLPKGRSRHAYMIISVLFTFFLVLLFLRNLVLRPYFNMF